MDSRAKNAMDARTLFIHTRLEQWAKWSKENLGAWPVRTIIGRLIDEGPGSHHVGRPPVSMPEPVAQTDAAVAKLGEIDQRVIKVYYQHWEPVSVLCRRARMPENKFKTALRRARWRVSLQIIE